MMFVTDGAWNEFNYQKLFVSVKNKGSGNVPQQHQCLICKYTSYHLTTMKRHVRAHTGERPYRCTMCDKRFIQNADLKKHMKSHYKSFQT